MTHFLRNIHCTELNYIGIKKVVLTRACFSEIISLPPQDAGNAKSHECLTLFGSVQKR